MDEENLEAIVKFISTIPLEINTEIGTMTESNHEATPQLNINDMITSMFASEFNSENSPSINVDEIHRLHEFLSGMRNTEQIISSMNYNSDQFLNIPRVLPLSAFQALHGLPKSLQKGNPLVLMIPRDTNFEVLHAPQKSSYDSRCRFQNDKRRNVKRNKRECCGIFPISKRNDNTCQQLPNESRATPIGSLILVTRGTGVPSTSRVPRSFCPAYEKCIEKCRSFDSTCNSKEHIAILRHLLEPIKETALRLKRMRNINCRNSRPHDCACCHCQSQKCCGHNGLAMVCKSSDSIYDPSICEGCGTELTCMSNFVKEQGTQVVKNSYGTVESSDIRLPCGCMDCLKEKNLSKPGSKLKKSSESCGCTELFAKDSCPAIVERDSDSIECIRELCDYTLPCTPFGQLDIDNSKKTSKTEDTQVKKLVCMNLKSESITVQKSTKGPSTCGNESCTEIIWTGIEKSDRKPEVEHAGTQVPEGFFMGLHQPTDPSITDPCLQLLSIIKDLISKKSDFSESYMDECGPCKDQLNRQDLPEKLGMICKEGVKVPECDCEEKALGSDKIKKEPSSKFKTKVDKLGVNVQEYTLQIVEECCNNEELCPCGCGYFQDGESLSAFSRQDLDKNLNFERLEDCSCGENCESAAIETVSMAIIDDIAVTETSQEQMTVIKKKIKIAKTIEDKNDFAGLKSCCNAGESDVAEVKNRDVISRTFDRLGKSGLAKKMKKGPKKKKERKKALEEVHEEINFDEQLRKLQENIRDYKRENKYLRDMIQKCSCLNDKRKELPDPPPIRATYSGLSAAVEVLRAKCRSKDGMIAVLAKGLQGSKNIEQIAKNLVAPCLQYTQLDFDQCALYNYLRGFLKSSPETRETPSTSKPSECELIPAPTNFKIVSEISRCLLVSWQKPADISNIAGYEISINSATMTHINSATRTMTLLEFVDLTKSMTIVLHAVGKKGGLSDPVSITYKN